MSIEALRHIYSEALFGKGNCASTALVTLADPFKPRDKFLEAAHQGTYDIFHLTIATAIELYEKNQEYCDILALQTGKPSDFFWNIHRLVQHETSATRFVGGLIKSDRILQGIPTSHVFAISSIHRNRKVTLIDTAPSGMNSATPYRRKIDIKRLDKKLWDSSDNEFGAYAVLATPISILIQEDPTVVDEIKSTYRLWRQEAVKFVEVANYPERYFD